MESNFMDLSSPEGRRDEAKIEASLPVAVMTPLHPGEESPETPAVAGEAGASGCQPAPVQGHSGPVTPSPGITVARLAAALNLEVTLLQEQGLSDCKKEGLPAVRIPYLGPDGTLLATKWLLSLRGARHPLQDGKAISLPCMACSIWMRSGERRSLPG